MVSGYPTDATDLAIHANIAGAGYGSTTPTGVMDPSRLSPNTFHYDPSTSRAIIHVGLANLGQVSLEVVDLRGRRIATITQGMMASGNHDFAWDAKALASGIYFARLDIDGRAALTETFVVGG